MDALTDGGHATGLRLRLALCTAVADGMSDHHFDKMGVELKRLAATAV